MPEITPDMVGCWLDGQFGWHNHYRVVDKAVEFGFVVGDEYVSALDAYRDGGREDEDCPITGQGELVDMATDYLNEHAPDGYFFEWSAGELCMMEESESEDYDF